MLYFVSSKKAYTKLTTCYFVPHSKHLGKRSPAFTSYFFTVQELMLSWGTSGPEFALSELLQAVTYPLRLPLPWDWTWEALSTYSDFPKLAWYAVSPVRRAQNCTGSSPGPQMGGAKVSCTELWELLTCKSVNNHGWSWPQYRTGGEDGQTAREENRRREWEHSPPDPGALPAHHIEGRQRRIPAHSTRGHARAAFSWSKAAYRAPPKDFQRVCKRSGEQGYNLALRKMGTEVHTYCVCITNNYSLLFLIPPFRPCKLQS